MPDLIDTSLAGPRALRAAIGFLDRLPAIEDAVSGGGRRALDVLDELLERVRPIEGELEALRESARLLDERLTTTEQQVRGMEETAAQLSAAAIRLDGSVENLMDQVPGLSSLRR
jgi:cell division protein ZapA (FtsZ GTPase activity inhibitor)